jgi:hypothetical protein
MVKISNIINLRLLNWSWPDSHPIIKNLFWLDSVHIYEIQLTLQNVSNLITITIPEGFLHDKRSTPKFLWFTRPRDGRSEVAALIHDMLYRTKGMTKNLDLGGSCSCDSECATFTRKACDQIYKYAYQQTAPEKFGEAERDYFWLRIFGGLHFGKRLPPAARLLMNEVLE